MPTVASPAPVNPTGQLAQYLPGHDAAPIIAAQEQSLADYLNLPVQEILSRLGLAPTPNNADPKQDNSDPNPDDPQPATPQPPSGPGGFDPMGLIQPVIDALGTLGSGNFGNTDPTKMFGGISKAFDTTAVPLQQATAGLQDGWKGDASTAAANKTGEAIANGADVNKQAAELQRSLANAASQVQQSQTRLIAIVSQFQATIAAIGPNIIFPWGWAAAIAAATQAITMAVEVMTELQATLATEAAAVTAAGAPIAVTAAPQAAAALGPLTQMAATGISSGASAISSGVQSGAQAAQNQQQKLDAPNMPPGADGTQLAGVGAVGPGVGAGGDPHAGAGGGLAGGATVAALAPRSLSPMSAPATETTAAPAQPNAARTVAASAVGATGAGGMMGGAPMYGAGKAGVSGHAAASFLHTSDQGDEIVGDLGTAAPPVIGELDPNDTPDIELRI